MNYLAVLGQNGKVYVVICKVLLDISQQVNCVLMAMIECLKLNVVTGFAWQRRLEIVSHCAGSRLYKVTTGSYVL